MAVKTTGAEWKRFYSDETIWPPGAYHEDEEILIDGAIIDFGRDLMDVSDSAIISISGGVVCFNDNYHYGPSLESYFRRWRKKQNTVFILCEAPKDRAAEVEAAIVASGGRVQKL